MVKQGGSDKTICTASQSAQCTAINETPAGTKVLREQQHTQGKCNVKQCSTCNVKQCKENNNLSTAKFVNRAGSKQSPFTMYLIIIWAKYNVLSSFFTNGGSNQPLCLTICRVDWCTSKHFLQSDCTCPQRNMYNCTLHSCASHHFLVFLPTHKFTKVHL